MARDLDALLSKTGVHMNELFPKIHPEDLIEQRDRSSTFFATTYLIFNEDEIAVYIPRNALRFAILREPLSQTLSALQ